MLLFSLNLLSFDTLDVTKRDNFLEVFRLNECSEYNNEKVLQTVDSLYVLDSTNSFLSIIKTNKNLLELSMLDEKNEFIIGLIKSNTFARFFRLGFMYDVKSGIVIFMSFETVHNQPATNSISHLFVMNKDFYLSHLFYCRDFSVIGGRFYHFFDDCKFSVHSFSMTPYQLEKMTLYNLTTPESLNITMLNPSKNNMYSIPPIIGTCR